jgi:hypothetical protein
MYTYAIGTYTYNKQYYKNRLEALHYMISNILQNYSY